MTGQRISDGKSIVVFLALTAGLSSTFWVGLLRGGDLTDFGALYILGLMWSPGVAALLTIVLTGGSFRSLGWKLGGVKYLSLAYVLPLVYAGVVYVPVWLAGWGDIDRGRVTALAERFGTPDGPLTVLAALGLVATIGAIGSLLSATGEEIGWRGFLVPALARRHGPHAAALGSGAIWALWHYPLILLGAYRGDSPRWFSVLCFTILVIGISVSMAWLRLVSGSLWTGAMLHATHNAFVQQFFDPLTADTGPTGWIIGEFGAGLALTGLLVAVLFWRPLARCDGAERATSP